MSRRALAGSERGVHSGAVDLGQADPDETLEVSILVRRQEADAFSAHVERLKAGSTFPDIMSREAFTARHGAAPDDLARLAVFASEYGLAVVESDAGRRTVRLSGTVAQFNDAFGVSLRRMGHADGDYRGRTGVIELPDDLHGLVEAVLGLDNRPQARPHFRLHPEVAAAAPAGSFTPAQVAALYAFPGGTGAGETIGIIELGGGFDPQDLATYFQANGVSPAPTVTAVAVDGAANLPTGDPNGPDGEVMLDIEIAGVVAPGAQIVVYFAPNTDAGFIDAVTTAVHDTTYKPSVVSISWGGPESSWTAQSTSALDQAFQAAATLGVTITVASGDNGSSDGVTDGADHVDFPASSPNALACGGTSLVGQGNTIQSESVWNDGENGGAGGGGVSTIFALPANQQGLTATMASGGATPLAMRGVPDVSGNADPQTGYQVRIDGTDTVVGGTSAVAPLWAGLIALINAARGTPVGYLNTALYAAAGSASSPFNDITSGDNGDFVATVGWDACTGLGSPNGAALVAALAPAPAPAA
jgi:kumamolisin